LKKFIGKLEEALSSKEQFLTIIYNYRKPKQPTLPNLLGEI